MVVAVGMGKWEGKWEGEDEEGDEKGEVYFGLVCASCRLGV